MESTVFSSVFPYSLDFYATAQKGRHFAPSFLYLDTLRYPFCLSFLIERIRHIAAYNIIKERKN